MTRSNARELALHLVFALSFGERTAQELLEENLTREHFQTLRDEEPLYAEFPNEKQRAYITTLVEGVAGAWRELDRYIEKYAIGWSLGRISRMARSVMRLAMYELLYLPDIPAAAVINEAVELTKHYETGETAAFVNGILGSFLREELPRSRWEKAETPSEEGEG